LDEVNREGKHGMALGVFGQISSAQALEKSPIDRFAGCPDLSPIRLFIKPDNRVSFVLWSFALHALSKPLARADHRLGFN
jgi:hypothetical protein